MLVQERQKMSVSVYLFNLKVSNASGGGHLELTLELWKQTVCLMSENIAAYHCEVRHQQILDKEASKTSKQAVFFF